jgi:hypothetical protein
VVEEPQLEPEPVYHVQIHTIEGYSVRYEDKELMIPMTETDEAGNVYGVARLYIDLTKYRIDKTGPYIVSVHDEAGNKKGSVVIVIVKPTGN